MKRFLLISLTLLLALSMVALTLGCPTEEEPIGEEEEEEEEEEEPTEPYGTLTVASVDFGVEAMDPLLFESTWGMYMYDSLITFDENGNYIGEVAETWDLADDGVTWTFYIREDIKFHNGDPLTAEDVYFTLDRFTSPESKNPWSPGLADNMASHRVVSDYVYEFVTINPEPPLVDSFCWVRILPKDYFESVGDEGFTDHPIGSGPWKFVEHVPETRFKVEANTDYWKPEHIPHFQYIVELQVPEEATQVAMLKRGEVDIALGLTTDRRVELEAEGWQSITVGLPSPFILAFVAPHYETAGPVHDIRIRKALSYSIDREELCATYYQGEAEPGGRFFLMPGGYGATDDLIAPDPYDPDLAMSLMADAGYPDAFEDPVIHAMVTPGPGVELFEALEGYWSKVGLQVQIEIVEMGVFMAYMFMPQGCEPDAPNVGWIWSWTGGAFNGTYYCRNMYTSYGVHVATVDPAVDALFDQYIVELDPDRAKELYIEWQRAAKELYTSFGVVYLYTKYVVSDNVGGVTDNSHMFFWDAACGITHSE